MCGKIRFQGKTYSVNCNTVIPKEMIIKPDGNHSRNDIRFSGHRFMRYEKISSFWSHHTPLYEVQILADEFEERGKWFPTNGKVLRAYVHHVIHARPRHFSVWAISIVTVPATGEVAKTHHRMPDLNERRLHQATYPCQN